MKALSADLFILSVHLLKRKTNLNDEIKDFMVDVNAKGQLKYKFISKTEEIKRA